MDSQEQKYSGSHGYQVIKDLFHLNITKVQKGPDVTDLSKKRNHEFRSKYICKQKITINGIRK